MRESSIYSCDFEYNRVLTGQIAGEAIGGAIQDLSVNGGFTIIFDSLFKNNSVTFNSTDTDDSIALGGALAISNKNALIIHGNKFIQNSACSAKTTSLSSSSASPSFGKKILFCVLNVIIILEITLHYY